MSRLGLLGEIFSENGSVARYRMPISKWPNSSVCYRKNQAVCLIAEFNEGMRQ